MQAACPPVPWVDAGLRSPAEHSERHGMPQSSRSARLTVVVANTLGMRCALWAPRACWVRAVAVADSKGAMRNIKGRFEVPTGGKEAWPNSTHYSCVPCNRWGGETSFELAGEVPSQRLTYS